MRAKRLAKIIELAEILHEPVEHECLRPLMTPTQKEELKGDKSLASPQTHNSGKVINACLAAGVRQVIGAAAMDDPSGTVNLVPLVSNDIRFSLKQPKVRLQR